MTKIVILGLDPGIQASLSCLDSLVKPGNDILAKDKAYRISEADCNRLVVHKGRLADNAIKSLNCCFGKAIARVLQNIYLSYISSLINKKLQINNSFNSLFHCHFGIFNF